MITTENHFKTENKEEIKKRINELLIRIINQIAK